MSTPRNTGAQSPARRGRIARVVSAIGSAVLVGSIAVLAACSDAPSAPRTPVAPSLGIALDPVVKVGALTRVVPLERSETRSWTFKRNVGGTIDWPEVGLKVSVPANAFAKKSMTISVTALAGSVVAYDFGPDGSTFDVPLVVTQDLKNTSWYHLRDKRVLLRGAYFKSATQIDNLGKTAVVNAFEDSSVDLSNSKVKFTVHHFSGYMVSMD